MALALPNRLLSALAWIWIAIPAFALEGPKPILVGGAPLNVKHVGHAAPFVADFDGDGKKDLLVGEFYKGRLRIYQNTGSNAEPRFDHFSVFQKGAPSGCIWSSCCMGFGPQLIDFDADGDVDILSGNWPGNVVIFSKNSDGTFAPGEFINASDGKPIKIDYGVYAFATDWDSDGDLDLLAGTVGSTTNDGNVYLVTNNGTAQKHQFSEPTKLVADGKEIVAPDGHTAPAVADWDRDGKLDLILGCGDGSVVWYRNVGSREVPELSASRTLIPAPAKDEDRGIRARVCVTDWNEDGELDLLIGDFGKQFAKVLSEEEEQWRREAQQRQQEFLATWAKTFKRYRQLLQEKADGPESAEIVETRGQLTELKNQRSAYYEEEQALQPGRQFHGRVWLYLGRNTNGGEKAPG